MAFNMAPEQTARAGNSFLKSTLLELFELSKITIPTIPADKRTRRSALPARYFSKLIGANPIRKIGMTSFAPVLNGLGLKCQFIEDQEATERLKNRVLPRNPSYIRGGVTY